jgi:hypothetical protein
MWILGFLVGLVVGMVISHWWIDARAIDEYEIAHGCRKP